MRRSLLLATAAVLLAAPTARAADLAPVPGMAHATPEMLLGVAAGAVDWKPAVIADPDALIPGPPPVWKSPEWKAEMAEILAWQKKRGPDDLKAIAYWNDTPTPMRWSEEVRAEIITASMVPPRGARALAIVHAAMYDAMLVAWRAKARYRRAIPVQENPYLKPVRSDYGVPTYPSEHAAIAMAAAKTMAALFPDHEEQILTKAKLVGETRIAAGAAHRTDVDAGFKIGEAVAREVLAARMDDGAEQPNPPVPKINGKWWVEAPMESGAGSWKPWLLKSGSQFRMTYDGGKPDVQEVVAAHAKLTPKQIERAVYWNFDVPAILWNDIARRAALTGKAPVHPDAMAIVWSDIARREMAKHKLDTPHAARMLNTLHLTLADAFIACWDTKYMNRVQRPYMLAPGLKTVVPTPPHPSWPSGHATASMAAAKVLGKYFPGQAKAFEAQAQEAALSRLWAGIHFRKDNEDGLKFGARIAGYDIQQAEARGWFAP